VPTIIRVKFSSATGFVKESVKIVESKVTRRNVEERGGAKVQIVLEGLGQGSKRRVDGG
jgi:hypothetical protein